MFEYLIDKLNDTNYDETVILGTLLVILQSNVDKYTDHFDSIVFGSSNTVFDEEFKPQFDGVFGDDERNIFTDVVAKMLLVDDIIVDDVTFSFKDFTIVFNNKCETFEQKFINLAQVFYEMQFCGNKLMGVTGVSDLRGIHNIMVIVENILMTKQKSLQVVYYNNKYLKKDDRMKAEEFPSSNVDFQRVAAVKDLKKKVSVPTSSDIKHQIIILDDPKMEVDKINNLIKLCNLDTVMILVGIDGAVTSTNDFVHIKKVNANLPAISGGADMCDYLKTLIERDNLAKDSVISTANYKKLIKKFKTQNNDKLETRVMDCLNRLGYTVAKDCDKVLKELSKMGLVGTKLITHGQIDELVRETELQINEVKSCLTTLNYTFEEDQCNEAVKKLLDKHSDDEKSIDESKYDVMIEEGKKSNISEDKIKKCIDVLEYNVEKFEDSLVETPTLLSVSNNGNKEEAERLIRDGAVVNQVNDKGQTPLYIASTAGHKDVVEVLIKNGAKVDQATTDDGQTPLFAASSYGYKEVVEVLIKNGAKVDQANNEGYTPVTIAVLNGRNGVLDVIKQQLTYDCRSVLQTIIDEGLSIGRHIMYSSKNKIETEFETIKEDKINECLSKLGYIVPLDDSCDLLLNALRDFIPDITNSTIYQKDYDNLLTKLNVTAQSDKTNLKDCLEKLRYRVYLSSTSEETKNSLSFESSANIKETGVANRSSPQVFDRDKFLLKLTQQLIDKVGYTININDFSDIGSFFDKKQIGNNYEIQPITRSGNEFKFDPETGEKDDSEHTYYEFSLKGQLDESSKVVNIDKFGKVVHFMGGAPQVPITLKIRLKVPIKKEEEKKEEGEPQTPIDPLKKLFGMYHRCDYKLYEFNGEISDEEFTGDNLDTIVRYVIFSNIVVYIQS